MRIRKQKKEETAGNLQQQIEGKEQYYSEEKFTEKLTKSGGKLGHKAMYAALLLFEALKSPKLPNKTRMTILGALGYLILPVDVMPDFLPAVGLVDDAGLLIAALVSVYNMVNDEMRRAAHQRMKKWFGEKYDAELVDEEINKSL